MISIHSGVDFSWLSHEGAVVVVGSGLAYEGGPADRVEVERAATGGGASRGSSLYVAFVDFEREKVGFVVSRRMGSGVGSGVWADLVDLCLFDFS
jgi:hypothetical protein